MVHKWIATPSRTNEILKRYGLQTKKSLGQNFLMEPQILTDMISAGQVDKETDTIEIGPGIGALTEFLGYYSRRVLAYEIDTRLISVLETELERYDNVNIIHQDILKANLVEEIKEYLPDSQRLVVLANLPYYITTPIIFKLLESGIPFDMFVLMMQKEVADRLTAVPNSKAYGALTIVIQYYCEAHIDRIVPKTVFKPRPNVDSAVLVLKRRETPYVKVKDEALFFRLVRGSFQQRRKTLWNNLKATFGTSEEVTEKLREALEMASIAPTRRAETLTIEEFATLANQIVSKW